MICNLLEIIRVFEQWMRSTAFGKKCRTKSVARRLYYVLSSIQFKYKF